MCAARIVIPAVIEFHSTVINKSPYETVSNLIDNELEIASIKSLEHVHRSRVAALAKTLFLLLSLCLFAWWVPAKPSSAEFERIRECKVCVSSNLSSPSAFFFFSFFMPFVGLSPMTFFQSSRKKKRSKDESRGGKVNFWHYESDFVFTIVDTAVDESNTQQQQHRKEFLWELR